MMPQSEQPAVMFDMDGLLLDTERVILNCFVETRRFFGLSDSPEAFLRCVGLRGDHTVPIIRESLKNGVDYDAFNAEWDQRIGVQLSESIPMKPGAKTLVRVLGAKGVAMGVATSTNTARARDQLGRSGLLDYMACVVGGDLVDRHKPDPQVYHKVAELLGTRPSQCIAFEDSEAGTRAAVASGSRTVQVPDLIAPSEQLRQLGHLIAPDLMEGALAVGLISQSDLDP